MRTMLLLRSDLQIQIRGLCLVAFAVGVAPAAGATEDPHRLFKGRTQHTATRLSDGSVLVVGGMRTESLSTARGDAERLVLDPDGAAVVHARRLGLAPRFFPQRAIHSAILLPDDRVLIAGGNLSGVIEWFIPTPSGSREIDEGTPGHFVAGPRLPSGGRAGLVGIMLLDGRVLFVGGAVANGSPSDCTELFDPSTNAVVQGPVLNDPRVGHTVTRLGDGRVLIAGGVGLRSTEWFDPADDTLSAGPELGAVRDDHAATLMPDGSLLITGGQDSRGHCQATVEVLSAGAERFEGLGSMIDARADHAQVLMPDGSVWVIGGERETAAGDEILRSVERFDPEGLRFERVAELEFARDDTCAVVIGPTRILVIGGLGQEGTGLDSLEWIDSAVD